MCSAEDLQFFLLAIHYTGRLSILADESVDSCGPICSGIATCSYLGVPRSHHQPMFQAINRVNQEQRALYQVRSNDNVCHQMHAVRCNAQTEVTQQMRLR